MTMKRQCFLWLSGGSHELTLTEGILGPFEERKLPCTVSNIHVWVLVLAGPWLVAHVSTSRRVLIMWGVHLLISISGGRETK